MSIIGWGFVIVGGIVLLGITHAVIDTIIYTLDLSKERAKKLDGFHNDNEQENHNGTD